jgi:uncharacterized protein (TIGR02453 family)
MFDGFSPKTLKFLSSISRNNNREWFEKHRSTYDSEVLDRAKAFVMTMDPLLAKISPNINAEPRLNASIRRIHRDVRFSHDKKPYNDFLDLYFRWGGGRANKKESPGFYLRIAKDRMWIGGGFYRFQGPVLQQYREAVGSSQGEALVKAVASAKRAGYDVSGEHYKRVPRGFDPEHPRAELLRYNGLHAISEVGIPDEFTSVKFAPYCTKHYKKVAPLVEWLSKNVG